MPLKVFNGPLRGLLKAFEGILKTCLQNAALWRSAGWCSQQKAWDPALSKDIASPEGLPYNWARVWPLKAHKVHGLGVSFTGKAAKNCSEPYVWMAVISGLIPTLETDQKLS